MFKKLNFKIKIFYRKELYFYFAEGRNDLLQKISYLYNYNLYTDYGKLLMVPI